MVTVRVGGGGGMMLYSSGVAMMVARSRARARSYLPLELVDGSRKRELYTILDEIEASLKLMRIN